MIRGPKVPECNALPSLTENLPERPLGSLFGDNPSVWALGPMGQIHMGRTNPFGTLVAGLTADEFLLHREDVDEMSCRNDAGRTVGSKRVPCLRRPCAQAQYRQR